MIQKVLDRLSVAFAGAVLGFLMAEYGFGATGLERPQNLAFGGLVLTLGALGIVRAMGTSTPSQDSDRAI